MTERSPSRADRLMLGVLLLDAALLAMLELFFLPLRVDGTVLPKAGDFPAPITVLLAMVTTPLLVNQASRYTRKPAGAVAPLAIWLLTLIVFGLLGPGHDMVLLPDWRTILLLASGALPGAVSFALCSSRSARCTIPSRGA